MHCEEVVLQFSQCSVLFIPGVRDMLKVNFGPVNTSVTSPVVNVSMDVSLVVHSV